MSRNRVIVYRLASLHRLAELIPWNRFCLKIRAPTAHSPFMIVLATSEDVPQDADPHHALFLYAREGRQKSFLRGNYPSPPHWDRRAIQPYHIKFRACSALAPMETPPISESAELARGGPLVNSLRDALASTFFYAIYLQKSRQGSGAGMRSEMPRCPQAPLIERVNKLTLHK